jgi:hypothetical protein
VPASRKQFQGTELRLRYQRARKLDLAAQTVECIDYLGDPEVLVGEFVDSYCAVDELTSARADAAPIATQPPPDDELVLEHFYPGRRVEIAGDPVAFRCLTSRLAPLTTVHDATDPERTGLDYLAVDARDEVAILGVAESENDSSLYLLLLRALACLSETAPESQRAALESRLGAPLPWPPRYDLHLVTWERGAGAALLPLDELAHDLADAFVQRIAEEFLFPKVLRSIACFRMAADDFTGQLQLAWRVNCEALS